MPDSFKRLNHPDSPVSVAETLDSRDSLFSFANVSSASDLALLVEEITRACDTHRDEQSKVDEGLFVKVLAMQLNDSGGRNKNLVSVKQSEMLDNQIKGAGVNFACFLRLQLVDITEMYSGENSETRNSKIKEAIRRAIKVVKHAEDEVTKRKSKGIDIEAIISIIEGLKKTTFRRQISKFRIGSDNESASLGKLLDPLIEYSTEQQKYRSLLQDKMDKFSEEQYTKDFNNWLSSLDGRSNETVAPALPDTGLTESEKAILKKATELSLKDAIEAANNYRHNPPRKTYLLLLRLSNIDRSFEGIAVAFSPLSGCGKTELNENPDQLIENIKNVRDEIRDLEGQGQDNEIIKSVVDYLDTQQNIAGYAVDNKAKEEAKAKAKEEAEAEAKVKEEEAKEEAKEEEMRRAQSSASLFGNKKNPDARRQYTAVPLQSNLSQLSYEKLLDEKIQGLDGIIKEIDGMRKTSIFGEVDGASRAKLKKLRVACNKAKGLLECCRDDFCALCALDKSDNPCLPASEDEKREVGGVTSQLAVEVYAIEAAVSLLPVTQTSDSPIGDSLCQKICNMIRSLCCWMTTSEDRYKKQSEKARSLVDEKPDNAGSEAVTNRSCLMGRGQ